MGVLRHHIDALLDAGLLSEQRDGRLRRFFPVGLDAPTRAVLAGLRANSHRRVVLALLNAPNVTAAALAATLAMPASTVAHYLRALAVTGIVMRDDQGYRLVEPDRVARALIAYRPSFADRLVDAALEIWFEGE